jgi:hypothetical protein
VSSKADSRDRILLTGLLLFVAGLCLQPMTEADLFFRLKVGAEILATRTLPRTNLFSFTAPLHPDLDLSWAFEVAVADLYRVGGFPAVVVAKTVWIIATFAGAFAVCRRRGAGALASALALAGAAYVMRSRFVERPHVVSFAGEVLVIGALCTIGQPWSRRRIAAFMLAMVIWANMHAGIFVGVLIPSLAAAGAFRSDRGAARRALLLAFGIAAMASFNPVGPMGLGRYLALHVSLPDLHPVDEFRAATWRSDAPFFVWLFLLAAVVALPFASVRSAAKDVAVASELLPALGMIVLGLASVRFAADAVLVSAPILAVGMTSLADRLATRSPRVRGFATSSAATILTATTMLLATVLPRLAQARAGRPFCDVDLDTGDLPIGALRFAENNGLRERMYNDFETGSYLLFEGYPRYRVFVDPRLPSYPEEMHRLLGAFDLDRGTWGAAMNHYGVQSALLGYAGINRRVAWWDPREWALVYREGDSRVFVRRLEKWRSLIAAREIPATFDFTVEGGTTTRPLEPKPPLSPVTECEWQRRLGDLVFDLGGGPSTDSRIYFERALQVPGCLSAADESALAAWMGAIELGAPGGDHALADHALAHLERALALSPTDTKTRANRAIALERHDRSVEAVADWQRVAVEARGTPLGDAAAVRARDTARARAAGRQ